MTKYWASAVCGVTALIVAAPGRARPAAEAPRGSTHPREELRDAPEEKEEETKRVETKQRPKHGQWSDEPALVKDDVAGFAEEGQWAFSTDAALSIERRTQSRTSATTSVSIYPAADYFAVKNLSVGGSAGVLYVRTGGFRGYSLKVGPRIGYNFELGKLVSLWPKLGVLYSHTQSSGDGSDDASEESVGVSNDGIAINMFAPFMLLPASHFFAGFGPFLDTDVSGKNRATTWGFRLTLGGWL